MVMEKIRFCLVGAGRAGMVHALNVVNVIKNAELTAIVESDMQLLNERGRRLGVSHLFKNIDDALSRDLFDAVIVSTPTFTHRDVVVKCADSGKHIFCEKPMSTRVDEAEEMIKAVERNAVVLQIGFMRRFDPPFVRAKELIQSGDMGKVMLIKSVGRGPGLPPPWTYDVSRSNGLLGEVNSHDFDTARWFAGSDYHRVYAEAVNIKLDRLRKDYPDFYDNAVCTIRFKNEVIGTIDGTCPAEYGYDARTEILLTKGLVMVGEVKGGAFLSCNETGVIKEMAFRSWSERFREAYVFEIRSFIESVLEGKPVAVTGYDGLAVVKAVVAANLSLRSGNPELVE